MHVVKFAVVFMSVILVLKADPPAVAQDAGRFAKASMRQTDSFEHRASQSDASGASPSLSTPTISAFDHDCPTAPSITTSQDDSLDGHGRLFCNTPCPSTYVYVDALFLQQQPRSVRQSIVVDANTNTTLLSTSNLNFNFDPGLRATVGKRLRGGQLLEFSYFGLFNGSASAVAVRPDANAFLIFPGNLAGNAFVDMDRARVTYSSSLNGFEVNLPFNGWPGNNRGCGDMGGDVGGCVEDACADSGCADRGCGQVPCRSLEWLVGFRYLNLSQELNVVAQRTVGGAVEEGTYNIRTANNLFGPQIGARWRRTRDRFGWEVAGMTGIFGNTAQQRQSVTDFPNFPLRPTVSDSIGEGAFVSEINLSAIYRLTNVWNARLGYSVMWIDGVALASDQLDFNFATAPSGNQLHSGAGMFLQGVNVGLEARW